MTNEKIKYALFGMIIIFLLTTNFSNVATAHSNQLYIFTKEGVTDEKKAEINLVNFDYITSMTSGIQEVIDDLPEEGGTVFIPPGTYFLKTSIFLRSNISLIGQGDLSIIKPVKEVKSKLIQDVVPDDSQVIIEDPSGFEIGMSIIIKDDNSGIGLKNKLRTITNIDDNSLILDLPLGQSFFVDANGFVVNAFPLITADARYSDNPYSNILIKDLKLDGNKAYVDMYSWQQAGVIFWKVTDSIIKGVTVIDSAYDGISDQGFDGLGGSNNINNNNVIDCLGVGIHLGGACSYDIVSGNTILNSGKDGIFFCAHIQHAKISNNIISHGSQNGIGGIQGSDRYNIIERNIITDNKYHGIQIGDSTVNSFDNVIEKNIISRNSQELSGSYSGIYLENACEFVVKCNIICNNHDYGIMETGSSDYNMYIGNCIYKNIIGDMSLVGDHNTVVDKDLGEYCDFQYRDF